MAALTTICMIACHGGPAQHFNVFAKALEQKGYRVEIHATGPALQKFGDRTVVPFSIEEGMEEVLARDLAGKCEKATAVITDVGHSFDRTLHNALKERAPGVTRLAYYDNPEAYVPGGYSDVANQVIQLADRVLYANTNLAKGDNTVGIGFYPMEKADEIARRRGSDRESIRQKLPLQPDQKLLVYAGGNNEVYFSKAFPAFLGFLAEGKDLSDYVIMLQQHPGAKAQNRDGELVARWVQEHESNPKAPKVIISEMNSDDAQVAADVMLYYQTSMGPQFVLAGIPTIQIGHEKYEDILVKNKICAAASDADGLERSLSTLAREQGDSYKEAVTKGLGINPNWSDQLVGAL